jgi:hypothetical protein
MFIVFLKADYGRLEIPARSFDFGRLIEAQAIGDSQALIKRRLPTLLVAIDGDPAAGLESFKRLIAQVLKKV